MKDVIEAALIAALLFCCTIYGVYKGRDIEREVICEGLELADFTIDECKSAFIALGQKDNVQ